MVPEHAIPTTAIVFGDRSMCVRAVVLSLLVVASRKRTAVDRYTGRPLLTLRMARQVN